MTLSIMWTLLLFIKIKECDLRLVDSIVWSHHGFPYRRKKKTTKKKNLKIKHYNKSVVHKTQTVGTGQPGQKKSKQLLRPAHGSFSTLLAYQSWGLVGDNISKKVNLDRSTGQYRVWGQMHTNCISWNSTLSKRKTYQVDKRNHAQC